MLLLQAKSKTLTNYDILRQARATIVLSFHCCLFFLVDMSQSDGNTRKQPQFTDSYQITWWAVGQ